MAWHFKQSKHEVECWTVSFGEQSCTVDRMAGEVLFGGNQHSLPLTWDAAGLET